jgi:16S rRNA (guanine527-N7)-methyltransferase
MFAELLRSKLAGICDLSESQIERLKLHYELLTRWNKVLSLTSVRTLEESVERHYCESRIRRRSSAGRPVSMADIGSGAGFPGIPMAIVRPQCSGRAD